MTSSQHRISKYPRPFSTTSALLVALLGGILLTGFMALAHIDKSWHLNPDFHIIYRLSTNILLLFVVLAFSFHVINSHISRTWKFVIGIFGSLVIAAAFSLLSGWFRQLIYDDLRLSDPRSLSFARDIVVSIVAILLSLLIYNLSRRMQINIEKERLETENLMVRYEALENQLDPHFLFNSLNTLSGLIGNDDKKAQLYLQQLASTYRYIMQGKRLVSLEDELLFVRSYCQMMQIRYGDNLNIVENIDPKYSRHQIIPISIQLLIENAMKHNVVSERHPLTINIETTAEGNFRVSNIMQPKHEESGGTGLGLANLSKRYTLLCKRQISITNSNNIFAVEVPLIDPVEASHIMGQLHPNNKKERNKTII